MGWRLSARNNFENLFLCNLFGRLVQSVFPGSRLIYSSNLTMCADINVMRRNALTIFQSAVHAVLPHQLMQRCLRLEGKSLCVGGKSYLIEHNLHVVGIGKAAVGMVRAVEDILGFHIATGIASIPLGSFDIIKKAGKETLLPGTDSKIKFIEGGKDNLPDENSLKATQEIMHLVSSLKCDDILLVLISGGGSALLSAPPPPVTLPEKQHVIQLLSKRGATIQELNSVRKRLSLVKGGNLAKLARSTQVVALVLSDVIGDPLDLIASGPTVENSDSPLLPLDILKKYQLMTKVPNSVMKILTDLKRNETTSDPKAFDHVQNVLVGSNKVAVESAISKAESLGYSTHVLSTSLCGEARAVGRTLAALGVILCNCRKQAEVGKYHDDLLVIGDILRIPQSSLQELILMTSGGRQSPLCVIAAGETTVTVAGKGRGGRNQELSLSAALEMGSRNLDSGEILLLSGGTDGIDGPTDAAGALAHRYLVSLSEKQGLIAQDFLDNNDSYTFYSSFNKANDLLVIGHTGTNVMDIQVLLIH